MLDAETHHTVQLDGSGPADYRSVVAFFARQLLKELRLVGGYDVLYGKVKTFIRDHLFVGNPVNLEDAVVLRNLSEPEAGMVFDAETTGLPRNMRAPASDVENWPRIVQLAWTAYDAQGRLTAAESHIVRPDGFTIPDDATRIHGISTAQASRDGRDVREVLELFTMVIRDAEVLVSQP
jgi:DNA polymerase III epsilon subunit-like protein